MLKCLLRYFLIQYTNKIITDFFSKIASDEWSRAMHALKLPVQIPLFELMGSSNPVLFYKRRVKRSYAISRKSSEQKSASSTYIYHITKCITWLQSKSCANNLFTEVNKYLQFNYTTFCLRANFCNKHKVVRQDLTYHCET